MMEDFEKTEYERVAKVQSVIRQYGEENFVISYSGGKDSNVLHTLIDVALPNNKIPRVYCDTGIEYEYIRQFVKEKQKTDSRIHIITPQNNIRKVLETYGYPFKSKEHSDKLYEWQKRGLTPTTVKYFRFGNNTKVSLKYACPKRLMYQIQPDFKMKISDKCCENLKEKPLNLFKKKMNLKYQIIGIRRAEMGRRKHAVCTVFNNGELKAFQPLAPVSDEWEDYMIKKYDIKLPKLYYAPFNMTRTGCKGCPFALNLQEELDMMEKYLPNERKQCEIIWKPVYDEYRRIGYRLRKEK